MYNDYYDYPVTTNQVPFIIIAAILAIAASVLTFIYILPESKRPKLNGFFKKIADIFNFKSLLIEKIIKFTYVLVTLFTILYGFFMLFMQTFGQSLALAGILVMILGPIAIRLAYEMTMMFIILLKNVIEINNKTPEITAKDANTSKIFDEPEKTKEITCSNCNSIIADENANFCPSCGTKLEH